MLLLRAIVHRYGKDIVGSLFTGSITVILVVVVVLVMLKLASVKSSVLFL
jgi:hypothetical protein